MCNSQLTLIVLHSSLSVVPHSQIQLAVDCVTNTVVVTIEKYLCISEPMRLKPCGSRYQLYCCYSITRRLPGSV